MRRRDERRRRARDLAQHRHARAARARRALQPLTPLITWADARAREQARRCAVRTGRGAARAHRRSRAPDVAADQAHVVRAPRPADAGGRALVGRPEGLPDRGADRHAGHRAVVGVGHRPARSRDARLEPGGDRAGRRRRTAASGDPADHRDAAPGARSATSAPARCSPASPACRSAPAARSASPSTRHGSTQRDALLLRADGPIWIVGGAISNGGGIVRWAGRSLAPDVQSAADDHPDVAVLELAASVPPGSAGLVMLPYLLAERAPLWDPDVPGAYLGVRREHTRAHFVRRDRGRRPPAARDPRRGRHRAGDRHPGDRRRAALAALARDPRRDVRPPAAHRGRRRGHGARRRGTRLVGIGRASSPADAVAVLSEPPRHSRTRSSGPRTGRDLSEVRAGIPRLIGALEAVGGLFATSPASRGLGTLLRDRTAEEPPP